MENLKKALDLYDNILISAHVNPDGDAVGSTTALAWALKKMSKNVIVLLEEYGDKYDFLKASEIIKHNTEDIDMSGPVLFLALDCGDKERLGNFVEEFDNASETVNIDHHMSNTEFAKYNYVYDKSSTCEIIYEILKEFGIELDGTIAKSLYMGILTDTGGFRHSNTTSRTHEVAAELLKEDFSHTELYEELFSNTAYEAMKILGRALEKMELFFDGQVSFSCITEKDMEELGADNTHLGIVIDKLKSIKGVRVAIFLSEKETEEIKVSMRADGTVDICKIAMEFGGGGHFRACGCSILDSMEKAKTIILDKIEKELSVEVTEKE